jgi:catechol-2,3-dioxygenase
MVDRRRVPDDRMAGDRAGQTKEPLMSLPPLTHVAITVRDLAVSVPWYESVFECSPVLDEDTDPGFHHTVYLAGEGTLFGLHQHQQSAPAEVFSEHRVGLDHVAFGCEARVDLETWAARLDELGITHGGIKDAHYGSGLSFRDPDGIALELFAPPS